MPVDRGTAGQTRLPIEIARLLPGLTNDLVSTLGSDLVGAYLYGSAVAGGFDHGASDFDVSVVTARPIDKIAFDTLAGVVERLASREPEWADRLDIVFVGRPTIGTFRSGGPLLSISHEIPLKRFDDADRWLQTWYLIRAADTALVGPPVAEVIPPISLDEFAEEVSRDADRLVRRALETTCSNRVLAYTILTLARILRVGETGEIVPKDDAGRWLADRMPDARDVIETAIAVRHGGPDHARWRDPAQDLARRLGRLIQP